MHEEDIRVRTDARGAHWVGWVEAGSSGPVGEVIVVGGTEDEARARAEEYRDRWLRERDRGRG